MNWKKGMKTLLIIAGVVLIVLLFVGGGYVYNNLNFYKAARKKTMEAGFSEKQVTLADGTLINYAEGPNNGPALLLIHGQAVAWEDYASVLPELAKYYHVFAPDCPGHGKSSKNPALYNAEALGKVYISFIQDVIGEPVVISGLSLGGLQTVWLAANSPENVRGIVLEDPPVFTTEAARTQKTFAWVDFFEPIHRYLAQDEEKDFTIWYLKNSAWMKFFGNARESALNYAISYRQRHPNEPVMFFFMPPMINNMLLYTDAYDPRFGEPFYDASFNKNFDHAETLARIQCPSIFIHATWSYDANGILMGALNGDDAERVHSLIKNNVLMDIKSGHDVHFEKPQEFVKIMVDFLDQVR